MQTILAIDDEPSVRTAYKVALSDTYRLLLAGNGREGLGLLDSHHADLILLDLTMPQMSGKELLKALAREADVLLENFAAGTMDRLGLGWDVMHALNPRLIYGSATGYGLSGPDRDLLAMDHTVQAACGLMSITGEAGGPPARAGGTPCDINGA